MSNTLAKRPLKSQMDLDKLSKTNKNPNLLSLGSKEKQSTIKTKSRTNRSLVSKAKIKEGLKKKEGAESSIKTNEIVAKMKELNLWETTNPYQDEPEEPLLDVTVGDNENKMTEPDE